jgi:hypothetical protein
MSTPSTGTSTENMSKPHMGLDATSDPPWILNPSTRDGKTKLAVAMSTRRIETKRSLGKILILHFLGLAPAGYLAAPDNGA